jgi:uncharacterized protein
MKVVLFGATGMAGSRILTELLQRGHTVTAVARDASTTLPGATVVEGDALDAANVASVVKGADAVVSAYGPGFDPKEVHKVVDATTALIAGMKQAGVKRLIMVGGAGSLYVAPGVQLIDSGHLPAEWIPIAEAHRDALVVLKQSDLDWTNFSPAAFFQPGERTGKFRLGETDLIADASGKSSISAEDYAIALVDELENPEHVKAQMTIGY